MSRRAKTTRRVEPRLLDLQEQELMWHFYYRFGWEDLTSDNLVRGVTFSSLRKEGFRDASDDPIAGSPIELGRMTWVRGRILLKDISGVMVIRLFRPGDDGWWHDWTMKEDNFRTMTDELEALKMKLDMKAREIYRFSGVRTRRPGWDARLGDLLQEATPTTKMAVRSYLKRYQDFLAVCRPAPSAGPYLNKQGFFFDACKTKRQLLLYFDFIAKYHELFAGFKHAKRHMKISSPLKLAAAMIIYWAVYRTVCAIRDLDRRGSQTIDLAKRFQVLPQLLVAAMAGHSGARAVDEMTPSQWAYDNVAGLLGTKQQYVKKLFDRRRPMFRLAERLVKSRPSPEEVMVLKDPTPLLSLLTYGVEGLCEADWIAWIRTALVRRAI